MPLLGAVDEGLSRPTRRPDIEGLRGLVVTAAVAYHVVRILLAGTGSWGASAPPWLWWMGTTRFAVDAFFVLAGVFVTTSWWECRRRAGSTWPAVRDFAGRRARRILPTFWAAALVYGVLALLAGRINGLELGLMATTQQYLSADLPARVDLPTWSMTTEVQFYVALPLLALLGRRCGAVPLLVVTMVGCTLWTAMPNRLGLAEGLLPGRLSQFVAGMVVAHLVQRVRRDERPWAVRAASWPGVAVGLVVVLIALGTFHGATFQRGEDGWFEYALRPAVGVVIAALVLRMLTGSPVRHLENPAWRFLGLISYSLFLWHYPIVENGLDAMGLSDLSGQPVVAVVVGVALVLAASVAVAVLSYTHVEHRFGTRRRRTVPERVAGTADVSTSTTGSAPIGLRVRTSS